MYQVDRPLAPLKKMLHVHGRKGVLQVRMVYMKRMCAIIEEFCKSTIPVFQKKNNNCMHHTIVLSI